MKGKGFMKGIVFSHFLDTVAEWHALVQGLCEVLCPWPPRHKLMDEELANEIRTNHHYYATGRVLGVLAWVVIICVIVHIART